MSDHIPLADCIERHVYAVDARNFSIAVYRGNGGFLGPRVKFGDRYLFEEYHWDMGEPFGTVKPLRDLGKIDDGVDLNAKEAILMAVLSSWNDN